MEIDHKTRVSLFAAVTALPFLIGAILWLSSVATDAKEAKVQTAVFMTLILDVRDRLVRIEEHQKLRGK